MQRTRGLIKTTIVVFKDLENALLELVGESICVMEKHMDSKQDLEDTLKYAYGWFSKHVHIEIVGKLVAILYRC